MSDNRIFQQQLLRILGKIEKKMPGLASPDSPETVEPCPKCGSPIEILDSDDHLHITVSCTNVVDCDYDLTIDVTASISNLRKATEQLHNFIYTNFQENR